jgi:hypothetical protein
LRSERKDVRRCEATVHIAAWPIEPFGNESKHGPFTVAQYLEPVSSRRVDISPGNHGSGEDTRDGPLHVDVACGIMTL